MAGLFNSLPHFICKINLAKLLFTCSTEKRDMLCTAGRSVTVQESMLNIPQEEEEPSA